jgi:hypothetical protein
VVGEETVVESKTRHSTGVGLVDRKSESISSAGERERINVSV